MDVQTVQRTDTNEIALAYEAVFDGATVSFVVKKADNSFALWKIVDVRHLGDD